MQVPKRLEEALKEEAKNRGIDEEVLLIDKLARDLDPKTRAELYEEKALELLEEARGYLERKDLVQASEKAWGACASAVKAFAEKEGMEHYRHRQLEEVASKIITEAHDEELLTGWFVCLRLNANFYEGFMTEEEVCTAIKMVSSFVKRVIDLLEKPAKKRTKVQIKK